MTDGAGGRDDRAALLAPSGSRYRFHLRLPGNAELRTALGYALPGPAHGTLRFRVEVGERPESSTVVLDRQVPIQEGDVWQEIAVSLEPWSGREVALDLSVSGEVDEPAWAGWWAPEIVDKRQVDDGSNVILISLDTLRADHLGCYGYERATSPSLDAFAAGGIRFSTAASQSPWTRPSHRALLTGVYPLSRSGLAAEPLAAVLWRAGYRTLALTGGGQLDGRFGFSRGFEAFRIEDWLRNPQGVVDWLASQEGRRRFLFLHTYEIHDPYEHQRFADDLPPGRIAPGFGKRDWQGLRGQLSDEERRYIVALYDSGIAYTDEKLGELFAALDRSGLLDRSIVVVTSDHGEQFWEHGSWGHGQTVYDHQLLVPLLLHLPAALRAQLSDRKPASASLVGRVIAQQVSLVDLYPTLLDLLGVPLERATHGRSLRPLLEGRQLEERPAFAENTNIERFERKSLRTRAYKLVHSYPKKKAGPKAAERIELYDLRADAGELRDLADEQVEIRRVLEDRLRAIVNGTGNQTPEAAAPEELDPDLRRRLEALGYIDD